MHSTQYAETSPMFGNDRKLGELITQVALLRLEVAQIKRITRGGFKDIRKKLMVLDDLEAEVARETTVVDSVLALVTQLLAQVEANKTDPVRLQAIVDSVRANDDKLAAAVTANTPTPPAV